MKRKIFLLLLFTAQFLFSQMPNISNVWQNNSNPYIGTIGNKNQPIKLKITISEQNKKNDQEYFVSGYSLVDLNYIKFEGKFTITQYKDGRKRGLVFGNYELAEENKGKHSGIFSGKFTFAFRWNNATEKIENQTIDLVGNWRSYDGDLNLKTKLKNQ